MIRNNRMPVQREWIKNLSIENTDDVARQSKITLTSAVAGLTKLWAIGVYQQG